MRFLNETSRYIFRLSDSERGVSARRRPKESPSDLANGAYKVLVVLDVLAEALHDAPQVAHLALEVVKRAFDIGYLFQLSAMMGGRAFRGRTRCLNRLWF
jgi:hypothetical protein